MKPAIVRRLMLSPLPSSVCAQHSSTFGRCHDTKVHVAYARRERMRIVDSVLVDEDGADQSTVLWHLYRSHAQRRETRRSACRAGEQAPTRDHLETAKALGL